jgi:hypothetical protein
MRLHDIDGYALARQTVDDAIGEIHTRLIALVPMADYRLTLSDGRALSSASIGLFGVAEAVMRLTAYAQRGEPLDASVQEYCITLIPVASDALDDSGEPDPSTDLGLVVSCALAREELAAGRPVSTTRLAALGGVTAGRVRQLVAAGDLAVGKDDKVRARDALRWLSGRGVLGVDR